MAITIRPVEKLYFDGTHRSRSPEETRAAVEPLMPEIGVTEIIDVTPPLDRIGIPVFAAVRPGAARGAVRVHAGKGKEPVHARVSAMMEALERYCAEYRGRPDGVRDLRGDRPGESGASRRPSPPAGVQAGGGEGSLDAGGTY